MESEMKLPKRYEGELLKLPVFNERGTITKRARFGLENSLYLYSNLSRSYAKSTDNNPKNFMVEEVYIVGSCARENRIDSDLDCLLICPNIDDESANSIKALMSFILFNNRPKREAIDVYVRPFDKYPKRTSVDITHYIHKMIEKYNSVLIK